MENKGMKELKTENDIKSITGDKPSIIELGTPDTCMPCKMLQDNLHKFEDEKIFANMEYYCCSDPNRIIDMGYKSVPVMIMLTNQVYDVETDTSILRDEDELHDWIEARIQEKISDISEDVKNKKLEEFKKEMELINE